MFRFGVLVILAAVTLANAHHGKIVGGHDVDVKDVPYQLSLQFNNLHICSAVLISDKYAVTAANCLNRVDSSKLSIRAGTSTRESGGAVVKVQKTTVHPKWSIESLDYDMAVLELQNPFSLKNEIQPIKLPSADLEVAKDTKTTISGWGMVKEGANELSKNLQAAEIPTLSKITCRALYPDNYSERMICAGTPLGGTDVCQGDGGSPMVADGVLIGLASWGIGCARPNYPGVYSFVPKYMEFINEVTGL